MSASHCHCPWKRIHDCPTCYHLQQSLTLLWNHWHLIPWIWKIWMSRQRCDCLKLTQLIFYYQRHSNQRGQKLILCYHCESLSLTECAIQRLQKHCRSLSQHDCHCQRPVNHFPRRQRPIHDFHWRFLIQTERATPMEPPIHLQLHYREGLLRPRELQPIYCSKHENGEWPSQKREIHWQRHCQKHHSSQKRNCCRRHWERHCQKGPVHCQSVPCCAQRLWSQNECQCCRQWVQLRWCWGPQFRCQRHCLPLSQQHLLQRRWLICCLSQRLIQVEWLMHECHWQPKCE